MICTKIANWNSFYGSAKYFRIVRRVNYGSKWIIFLGFVIGFRFDKLFNSDFWQNIAIWNIFWDLQNIFGLSLFRLPYLSGILAKSGPLDFATKNSFPLFFVCEKSWYTCIKTTLFIFQFFIFALLQAKNQFCPQRGFQRWSKGWNLWILRGALRPIKCSLRNFALS